MSAPRDSVGDLCVALRHRWNPSELFVIFTAYFDEADTHGPKPTVILSAYLGHAYQWRRFETKLARIQNAYGFKIFHAKDYKACQGEFKGWPDSKRAALIRDLTTLVQYNVEEGISIFLEYDRYMNEYRAPPIPRKMNLDSQYGVCFRGCFGRILEVLEARGNKDRINIVMERGHTNVWDCERIFNDMKVRLARDGFHLLGDFTVSRKEESNPLMVADMLASAHSMLRTALKRGDLTPDQIRVAPNTQKGRLVMLELREDALIGLKAGFEEYRRIQAQQWHQRKQARESASAPSSGSRR